MSFLQKIFNPAAQAAQRQSDRQAELHKTMMRREARIGGQLFGPVPEGGHREFFRLDERTWVWHEEWQDGQERRSVTTRYDVRPDGFYKTQGSTPTVRIDGQEAINLHGTIKAYRDQVVPELERMRAQHV